MNVRTHDNVSHDFGSMCWCASYHPCVMRLCVKSFFDPVFALFICLSIFYFILLIFHFIFYVVRVVDLSNIFFSVRSDVFTTKLRLFWKFFPMNVAEFIVTAMNIHQIIECSSSSSATFEILLCLFRT